MTRAEEASIAYQLVAHGPRVRGGDAVLSDDDFKFWNINYDFVAGYEQAQKDLELTWEDMRAIRIIKDHLTASINGPMWDSKEFYEEILRRFNKAKNKK